MHCFARSFLSCTAHTCGSSLLSMIGIIAHIWAMALWAGGKDWEGAIDAGTIGVISGILPLIGSSILMCCAPKSAQEGCAGGKFIAVRKSTLLAATPNPTPYARCASRKTKPCPPCRTGRCAAPYRWHHPADRVCHRSWHHDCPPEPNEQETVLPQRLCGS